MAIHFDQQRMELALANHNRWWLGTLGRPLVKITLQDAYLVPAKAPAPLLSQGSCAQLQWSPEQVVEALDESLSRQEYLGDAFPFVGFEAFGPGVLAAFLGARLDNSSGGVWFFPQKELPIQDIHVAYDPANQWAERIKAIYRAGLARWQGQVIMGLPDLGGVLDVAASLRGTENLLLDLYDAPEEVRRLCGEIQSAWYAAYADFAQVLAPQKAFSHWSGLLSSEPSYITQCDFCYMISQAMFRAFVLETLCLDTRRLQHVIYHLDGIGQLQHLADILAIQQLRAVQWVYGDGQPSAIHWLDVYRRIQESGKQIMIVGGPTDFLDVLGQIHGSPYTSQVLRACQGPLAERLLQAR